MGFFSKISSALVKTALTPVAVIKDTANILTDQKPDATKKLLESTAEDVKESIDDLGDGDAI